LSEVGVGERVGLLQENDRWFTVYFAQHPIAYSIATSCE